MQLEAKTEIKKTKETNFTLPLVFCLTEDKQQSAHFRCAEMKKGFGIGAEQDRGVLRRQSQNDLQVFQHTCS